MTRSTKKGPYVHPKLAKRVAAAARSQQKVIAEGQKGIRENSRIPFCAKSNCEKEIPAKTRARTYGLEQSR